MVVGTGTALVVAIAAAFHYYIPPNTFVLRSDGFHPRTLTIEPGTVVTFVNRTDKTFWPASNSHPQHDQYATFDSGRPIDPGESWSFTFETKGKWGFHDHLRSFYTGAVAVGAEYEDYDCIEDIANLNVAEKRICWNENLLRELQEHGAKAAFTLFSAFYRSDEDFTRIGCHVIAHQLGDAAYGEYVRYGNDLSKLEFPPESVYCGYGYYHGILEHLIRDNPAFEEADAFCKMLIREHEDEVPRIRLNCYHAIGHGFIPEPTNLELWGKPHELPKPAIAACSRLTELDARTECYQGAFNVIGDWMWTNQFGLKFPKVDSLLLCRSFDNPEVANACYYELSMRILPYADDSLRNAYNLYVAQITDDTVAGMVINSAAASVVGAHIAEDNFIPFLKECRSLPSRVHEDCLKGLTGGFVAHGEPGNEYIKAVAFCADSILTVGEKEICYENIVRTFKTAYSNEKIADICQDIEVPYQKYCASMP